MVELDNIFSKVEGLLGAEIERYEPLKGGMIGEVLKIELEDERVMILKMGDTPLDIEADMLRYLKDRSELPVPEVYHYSENFILMEYVEGHNLNEESVEREAAEYLSDLHSIKGDGFGFDFDTLTGPVIQPNEYMDSWIEFFRRNRLQYMNEKCLRSGSVSRTIYERIDELSEDLSEILIEPERPYLIHGDVWKTNLIVKDGRIQAFLDPAIYFAHPEIELAYISFAGTFSNEFYEFYDELSGINKGFFEKRCAVYNLYPLLVHAYLFGEDYPEMIDKKLKEIGF
ncbi:MAG: fructosamine kinase family protein [Thermoplasmatota archaeon]